VAKEAFVPGRTQLGVGGLAFAGESGFTMTFDLEGPFDVDGPTPVVGDVLSMRVGLETPSVEVS
jgi:hypothetical protein